MLKTKIVTIFVFVSFLCFSGRVLAQGRDVLEIKWPSREYSTIQEAVNALSDGGVLEIAEGEYVIKEPIFVMGKQIVIKGAGSGLMIKDKKIVQKDKNPFTHLIGPLPQPVLDEDRNVILPAKRIKGLFNCIAADAVVRDIKMSGFDAGIVVKNDDEGKTAPVMVSNVLVTNTGRGILSFSSDEVTIISSAVLDTLWHGIVMSSAGLDLLMKSFIKDTFIHDSGGAAVCFNDTYGVVTGGDVAGGEEGGIVCFECNLFVLDSHIHSNCNYGILLLLAKNTSLITNNVIEYSTPDIWSGKLGDGVTLALSEVKLWNNLIYKSWRAGLSNFGGHAALGNNTIQCANFSLEGEQFLGHNFTFRDDKGNVCGCPTANGPCNAVSASLEPPTAIAP